MKFLGTAAVLGAIAVVIPAAAHAAGKANAKASSARRRDAKPRFKAELARTAN